MPSGVNFQKLPSDQEIEKRINPTLTQELWEYFFYFLKVFLSVAIIYLVIRTSVFDVVGISGRSMFPTYKDRDAIYIDQLTPKVSEFKRGEVIVLLAPPDLDGKRSLFIKRVVGLPGEKVVLEDGKVYIFNQEYPNGVLLDESGYLNPDVKTFKKVISGGERYEEEILKPEEYYVIGDNRTGSTDSRFFGAINKRDILGKEFYRVLPAEKSGFYKVPKYNISN
jgi:signal peptidase I